MLRRASQQLLSCLENVACQQSALGMQQASTSGRCTSLQHTLLDAFGTGSVPCASSLSALRSKYTWAFKTSASTPGLVFWKPRTPGLRHRISIDYKALGVYTGDPVPQLSWRKHNTGGRNNHGHITVRGRGGGIKKILRDVDFAQDAPSTSTATGVVERVEYDPNRTAFISLVRYTPSGADPTSADTVYKYHLAPHGLREGDAVRTGPDAPITTGNRLRLQDIPLGTPIHNIELVPGRGGQIARAAGTAATIKFKDDKFAVLVMPSGEVRRLPLGCEATVGTVSNPLHKLTTLGKAGLNRQRGRRPKVRGIAMNPVDHPHGGKGNGGRPSCTPWGVYCKGKRTRRRNKWTNKYIITRKGGVPIEKFVQAKKWRAAAERERKSKSGASLPAPNPGPPVALRGPQPLAWGARVVKVGGGQKKTAVARG